MNLPTIGEKSVIITGLCSMNAWINEQNRFIAWCEILINFALHCYSSHFVYHDLPWVFLHHSKKLNSGIFLCYIPTRQYFHRHFFSSYIVVIFFSHPETFYAFSSIYSSQNSLLFKNFTNYNIALIHVWHQYITTV